MKRTVVFCDVCGETFSTETVEFYLNGTGLDICGSLCFLKFWSEQYDKAKEFRSAIRATTGIEIIEGKRMQA